MLLIHYYQASSRLHPQYNLSIHYSLCHFLFGNDSVTRIEDMVCVSWRAAPTAINHNFKNKEGDQKLWQHEMTQYLTSDLKLTRRCSHESYLLKSSNRTVKIKYLKRSGNAVDNSKQHWRHDSLCRIAVKYELKCITTKRYRTNWILLSKLNVIHVLEFSLIFTRWLHPIQSLFSLLNNETWWSWSALI